MLDLGQLHKNTVYKNQGTPYSLTRTITKNGQPDILFHWHTDVEIIYVHEGTAKFHIDQEYFNSKAGDIILIQSFGITASRVAGKILESVCVDLQGILCHGTVAFRR